MAVTSKRETILEYLRVTTLPLINGIGNYNYAVGLVTRHFQRPNEYSAYPAICIVDDLPVNHRRLTSDGQYTVGSSENDVHDGMRIILVGTVKIDGETGDDMGSLSTAMNKLYSDMILAMHNDITLGNNVDSVTLISSHNSLQWSGQHVGVVSQEYALKYDYNPSVNIT